MNKIDVLKMLILAQFFNCADYEIGMRDRITVYKSVCEEKERDEIQLLNNREFLLVFELKTDHSVKRFRMLLNISDYWDICRVPEKAYVRFVDNVGLLDLEGINKTLQFI